jgi:hypothetical protein
MPRVDSYPYRIKEQAPLKSFVSPWHIQEKTEKARRPFSLGEEKRSPRADIRSFHYLLLLLYFSI